MSGSGVIDEDTARTLNTGRETAGAMLRTAQTHLQKVFIVFAVGMLATIMAMRTIVWPALERDLLAQGATIIAQTPFEVILLQVKVGLAVGVIVSIPPLLYYAREPLRERDLIPDDIHVSRWQLWGVVMLSAALFLGGTLYAYRLFFPIMFDFLATNAMGAGFAANYSIVHWTQFIMILGLSFGLAAQLPLVMTGLSYTEIVPYEVFRDKWRYAVVIMFGFGAVFSPPDPFTQVMWAVPLIGLYGFSLYLSKIVVTTRRGREQIDVRGVLRHRWNHAAGIALLAGAAVYVFYTADVVGQINRQFVARLPTDYRLLPASAIVGLSTEASAIVLGAVVALLAAVLALFYFVYRDIAVTASTYGTVPVGDDDPGAIDLTLLDEAGVRAAPPEAFDGMTEEQALDAARAAMADDEPDKAQAILDRFDEAEAFREATEDEAADPAEAEEEGGVFARTGAGMLNAFTEDETTEDDIGGWFYDIAFILDSLRSRVFWIAAVFIGVMVSVFGFLYYGGIGVIRADFLARMPAEVQPEQLSTWPVTLHPVEALVFEVKLSAIIGAIAVLPMLVYFAWPALEERGFVTGDRGIISVWGGAIFVGLVIGSILGYGVVAPNIISWLVYDALREGMVISYRVNNFFWLIFLTTAGIGLLADIPITMLLFHRGRIVTYWTMRRRWRVFVLGTLAFAALLTPDSLYTMFIIGLPTIFAYFVGLGLLWMATLGGRRGRPPDVEPVRGQGRSAWAAVTARWNVVAGTAVLVGGAIYAFYVGGGPAVVNQQVLTGLTDYRVLQPAELVGLSPQASTVVVAVMGALAVAVLVSLSLIYYARETAV
ncbi:twin-arginine translocase subunit TatC [Halobacteriaceae archaeon GCM10025711]